MVPKLLRAPALVVALVALSCALLAAPAAAAPRQLRIGLVANTAGLYDGSLNEQSAGAVKVASVRLQSLIDIRASASPSAYIPSLEAMAAQGYDLVIAVGAAEEHAVGVVAREYPKVSFAIVDGSYASGGVGYLPNVEGIVFKDQESGYLAGYLAGLVEQTRSSQLTAANIISTISGGSDPSVGRYVAGFRAGARAADPDAELFAGFANAASSQGRCRSIANTQIAAGSDIIFPVAGACSAGGLTAAGAQHVFAISAQVDQSGLGDFVLASAVDRADRAVYLTIEAVEHGTFRGGRDVEFGVAQNAVGLVGLSSLVPRAIRLRLNAVANELRAGRLSIPTALASGKL